MKLSARYSLANLSWIIVEKACKIMEHTTLCLMVVTYAVRINMHAA
jgi:hypothetical protein